MKRRIVSFILAVAFLMSCNEEIHYTGNLVVTSGTVTSIDGVPISQISVGLFDISELQEPFAFPNHALSEKKFVQGKIEFKGINPGNYVVCRIYTDGFKTVQVKAGQTSTINLFD